MSRSYIPPVRRHTSSDKLSDTNHFSDDRPLPFTPGINPQLTQPSLQHLQARSGPGFQHVDKRTPEPIPPETTPRLPFLL
jgi:hypothetical protein